MKEYLLIFIANYNKHCSPFVWTKGPATPNQYGPHYGKPTFPYITCKNGPNGDMFMNFMDDVDDDAMFMFTKGQVMRMHETLEGPRREIVFRQNS
jgi:hypothetical protein